MKFELKIILIFFLLFSMIQQASVCINSYIVDLNLYQNKEDAIDALKETNVRKLHSLEELNDYAVTLIYSH